MDSHLWPAVYVAHAIEHVREPRGSLGRRIVANNGAERDRRIALAKLSEERPRLQARPMKNRRYVLSEPLHSVQVFALLLLGPADNVERHLADGRILQRVPLGKTFHVDRGSALPCLECA